MAHTDKTRRGFGLLVRLLGYATEPGPEGVLRVLGKAIKQEQEFLAEQARKNPDANDYLEALYETASLQIEALLGSSFLACQVSINAARAGCHRLHEYQNHHTGSPMLAGHRGTKKDLFQRYSPHCACAMGYTEIEAIDACANYFKHNDGWAVDHQHDPPIWIPSPGLPKNMREQQQETIDAMNALGARPDSLLDNLGRAFRAILGDADYAETDRLAGIITSWANHLKADYQAECAKL